MKVAQELTLDLSEDDFKNILSGTSSDTSKNGELSAEQLESVSAAGYGDTMRNTVCFKIFEWC